MCWQNDFAFEDFGINDDKGEGVVSTYNCTNEECGTYVECYVGLNKLEDQERGNPLYFYDKMLKIMKKNYKIMLTYIVVL